MQGDILEVELYSKSRGCTDILNVRDKLCDSHGTWGGRTCCRRLFRS